MLTPSTVPPEAQIGIGVGVEEQPVPFPCDRGPRGEPGHMLGHERMQIVQHAAVREPHVGERRSRKPRVVVADGVDGEQERLVVAEEAAHTAAARGLESAHEVDRADPVGPAIDEVAHEPEHGVLPGPALALVDESRLAKQPSEDVAMTVDVAHDEQRLHRRATRRARTRPPRAGRSRRAG
jgi:hypothetical protein